MVLSPGRNSFFENIYRSVTRFVRSNISGSQRSVYLPDGKNSFTSVRRNYDLEILEYPVRNTNNDYARSLIEMTTFCPDVVMAIERIKNDIFSNSDGDDIGFKIDEEVDDGTPIDPQVKEILDNLFDRCIGGLTLAPAVERMIRYGDSFVSLGIGKTEEGLGVTKLLTLPTWEIFRIEDDQANLKRFEQRKSINDKQPDHVFHPAQLVHFRHNKYALYGRPIFGAECLGAWVHLKNAYDALSKCSQEIGYNPTVHIMPPNATRGYKDAYKTDLENQLSQGTVTHMYLDNGAEAKKLGLFDPNLDGLINTILLWRSILITKSQLPTWMFSGFTNINGNSAKEISEQPMLNYSRMINGIRMELSEGIKQICLTELILKGVPEEKQKFRICHPKIFVSTTQVLDPENEDEADPTNPNNPKSNPKPSKAKQAKTSSKTKGDALAFLQSVSKDELLRVLPNVDNQ